MKIVDSNLQKPNKPKEEDLEKIYKVQSSYWYRSFPYMFGFTKIGENSSSTIYAHLPINPQNLQISTLFSTNIINSLYGVIEEHSEQRWYDIQISGTTGIAPKYQVSESDKTSFEIITTTKTRASYSDVESSFVSGLTEDLLGNLGEIINKIAMYKEMLSSNPQIQSGLKDEFSGYKAFHDLYRFFLMYKEEVSKNNNKDILIHPLRFYNYKDNVCYDVIPINFSMQKSAESPMLYYYQISLKGYNMRNINKDELFYTKEGETGLEIYAASLKDNSEFAKIYNKAMILRNTFIATASYFNIHTIIARKKR